VITMLSSLTSTDVRRGVVALVPVGSTEQHGPHLPLDTDTTIATAVAHSVAERLSGEAVVTPGLTYGSSGEHQAFAGTISIGTDVLRLLVIEIVRSVRTWAGHVIFVNGHGGNTAALSQAVPQMIAEGHEVAWVPCATSAADLHAGFTETSLMLHLRADSVRMEHAEAGDPRPLSEILPIMMAGGVESVSSNGILGDPVGASAAAGEAILASMVDGVMGLLRRGTLDERGMLHVACEQAPS